MIIITYDEQYRSLDGEIIPAERIVSIHTLGSAYDMDSVEAKLDTGEYVRLKCSEILKFINGNKFCLCLSRKYLYLETIEDEE